MKRIRTFVAVLAVIAAILVVAQARGGSQTPASAVRFDEFAPTTFSVVTHDAARMAAAWADVLGVAAPPVNQPEVTYPPVFEGDRSAVVRMASLQMANMTVSMHQGPPGTYWRQIVDAQGELLYRMNFRVHSLADQTAYFEKKGGTLVIGDPAKVPYVNVNLWPQYGVALELNGVAEGAGPASARPAPPAGSFASHPVFKIAFVAPDLDQAMRHYADLFGIEAAPATGTTSAVAWATLPFPNGVLLELNEPLDGASIWRDHLQRYGRSIFGVGFRVESVREQAAYLSSKGGVLVFGGPDARSAVFDFTSRLGTVIEIHE